MLISRGDLKVFIERPISAAFLAICVLLIAGQIYVWLRKPKPTAEDKAVEAQLASPYGELSG
jgi:TctA family transporter